MCNLGNVILDLPIFMERIGKSYFKIFNFNCYQSAT